MQHTQSDAVESTGELLLLATTEHATSDRQSARRQPPKLEMQLPHTL